MNFLALGISCLSWGFFIVILLGDRHGVSGWLLAGILIQIGTVLVAAHLKK